MDPNQKRALSRSLQLEAVYLKALLYPTFAKHTYFIQFLNSFPVLDHCAITRLFPSDSWAKSLPLDKSHYHCTVVSRALINSQLIGTEKTSDHVGRGGKTADHFPCPNRSKWIKYLMSHHTLYVPNF